MKRSITILLTLFITIAFAQENPVAASGGYSKVYVGKEAAYEKAVAKHIDNGMAQINGPNLALK